jgi:hypothetical protein
MAVLVEEATLAVPGADLYFKIRGSGPMLVLIQGGGDADGTDAIGLPSLSISLANSAIGVNT